MTTTEKSILLLSAAQINQKIKRMAYEILEANFGEKELIFAGICEQGELIAKALAKHFDEISSVKITVTRIDLDKSHPFRQAHDTLKETIKFENKVIIMVDDVLHTGKTIAYGLKPFLSKKIKKIEVAVLVDRSHTAFPIKATYIGYELSTTLSDNIQVNLKGQKGVYLN
jgi:pyrimidine operon attenuation protein / uracil phosphoribosyltransferase